MCLSPPPPGTGRGMGPAGNAAMLAVPLLSGGEACKVQSEVRNRGSNTPSATPRGRGRWWQGAGAGGPCWLCTAVLCNAGATACSPAAPPPRLPSLADRLGQSLATSQARDCTNSIALAKEFGAGTPTAAPDHVCQSPFQSPVKLTKVSPNNMDPWQMINDQLLVRTQSAKRQDFKTQQHATVSPVAPPKRPTPRHHHHPHARTLLREGGGLQKVVDDDHHLNTDSPRLVGLQFNKFSGQRFRADCN